MVGSIPWIKILIKFLMNTIFICSCNSVLFEFFQNLGWFSNYVGTMLNKSNHNKSALK
jgi:hypothetical protein